MAILERHLQDGGELLEIALEKVETNSQGNRYKIVRICYSVLLNLYYEKAGRVIAALLLTDLPPSCCFR